MLGENSNIIIIERREKENDQVATIGEHVEEITNNILQKEIQKDEKI